MTVRADLPRPPVARHGGDHGWSVLARGLLDPTARRLGRGLATADIENRRHSLDGHREKVDRPTRYLRPVAATLVRPRVGKSQFLVGARPGETFSSPDRVIIGASSDRAARVLRDIMERVALSAPAIVLTPYESELAKLIRTSCSRRRSPWPVNSPSLCTA